MDILRRACFAILFLIIICCTCVVHPVDPDPYHCAKAPIDYDNDFVIIAFILGYKNSLAYYHSFTLIKLHKPKNGCFPSPFHHHPNLYFLCYRIDFYTEHTHLYINGST